MIKARGACKQGAGRWSDERRLLIKPGGVSLSVYLSFSLSLSWPSEIWRRVVWKGWKTMGDNACARHHCARVSACYGEEASLVEVAQERATTTSFTCGPCARCSPNAACVHASPTTADFSPTSYTRSKIKKKKKKLVYVQPCEFVPSHFVHHLRFQSDFRFVFPPILSSSFGIFLWNNSFVDIDLCF